MGASLRTKNRSEFAHALEHQSPRALAVQHYAYQGQLADTANVVFVQLAPGRWLRFFFDACEFFWRTVTEPDPPPSNDEYQYRIVDTAPELAGRTVSSVRFTESPEDGAELRITFEGGGQLVLRNKDDRNHLSVEP